MWSCFKPKVKKNDLNYTIANANKLIIIGNNQRIMNIEKQTDDTFQYLNYINDRLTLMQYTSKHDKTPANKKVSDTYAFLQSKPLYKDLMAEYTNIIESVSTSMLKKAFDLKTHDIAINYANQMGAENNNTERGESCRDETNFDRISYENNITRRTTSSPSLDKNIYAIRKFRNVAQSDMDDM
jgi:hypothetical protein